jgi:hypothetical protein
MFKRKRSVITAVAVTIAAIALFVFGIFGSQMFVLLYISHGQSTTLTLTQSGLVVTDPLTSQKSSWTFGGDALALNATHSHSVNSSGLYLGVQSPKSGEWAGYYAAQSAERANLYHATLTLPSAKIASGSFNTALVVQTTIEPINYIACGAGVNNQGYYWEVVIGTGTPFTASDYQSVYYNWLNNQSLAQNCTIVTDGHNLLTVYLGNSEVYSNNNTNLPVPPPFIAYLAVETTSTQMLYGSYSNFYATLGSGITIANAPIGGSVAIVDSSNNTIEAVPVNSDLIAVLPLTANAPLPIGFICVYDSTGTLVASTSQVSTLWGGDVFTLKTG